LRLCTAQSRGKKKRNKPRIRSGSVGWGSQGGRGEEGGKSLAHPLVEVDVEVVERDVRGGDEDVLDGRVQALEDCEVEHARGLGVHRQVRGHLPPVPLRRRRRRHRWTGARTLGCWGWI